MPANVPISAQKLIAWKNDILREARETLGHLAEESAIIPTWPTVLRRKPTGRSSSGRVTGSAS